MVPADGSPHYQDLSEVSTCTQLGFARVVALGVYSNLDQRDIEQIVGQYDRGTSANGLRLHQDREF